jgi:geranylgeranyl diphosphate synthase type I
MAAVARVGGAIELLHTFALLHDDVMDRSMRRRDRPTAHVGFAASHVERGLHGDPEWFGTSVAILAGDLAFVWADELLDSAHLPDPAKARARRVFNALRAEVMAGQYLDLLHAADPAADEATALRVALLKSARYTVTRPLQLGAALAEGDVDPEIGAALQRYGDAVGVGFQLRDDVLGLFGNPRETGKSTLDDLREGKRTLLVLRARRLADEKQRALIDSSLGDPTLDEGRAEEVRDIVASTGALASVELLIEHQHSLAIEALGAVPGTARSALRALAAVAIRRTL